MNYRIKHNKEYCIGCMCCQMACKDKHNLPVGINFIQIKEKVTHSPAIKVQFSVNKCQHCKDPFCLRVCVRNAITKDPDGLVIIDESKCVGCGKCVSACQFHAIFLHPEKNKALKCDGCKDALLVGKLPACVAACPMNCLNLTTALDGCAI